MCCCFRELAHLRCDHASSFPQIIFHPLFTHNSPSPDSTRCTRRSLRRSTRRAASQNSSSIAASRRRRQASPAATTRTGSTTPSSSARSRSPSVWTTSRFASPARRRSPRRFSPSFAACSATRWSRATARRRRRLPPFSRRRTTSPSGTWAVRCRAATCVWRMCPTCSTCTRIRSTAASRALVAARSAFVFVVFQTLQA